jgi:hypothetical protein
MRRRKRGGGRGCWLWRISPGPPKPEPGTAKAVFRQGEDVSSVMRPVIHSASHVGWVWRWVMRQSWLSWCCEDDDVLPRMINTHSI